MEYLERENEAAAKESLEKKSKMEEFQLLFRMQVVEVKMRNQIEVVL